MKKVTGIILAGGKSSRMGQDKGLMQFNGKPMIQHVIDVLKPLVSELIIVTNNNDYQCFNHPIYKDLIKDKGPLAGIYTGLHYSNTQDNLILSCDVPFVNSELLSLIIKSSKEYDVVVPERENQIHPLIGLYRKSFLPLLEKEIETNQLKLQLAIKKSNLKIISSEHIDKNVFRNINSMV